MLALQLAELRYDQQFGVATIRDGTEAALRELLRVSLARRNGTRMLAIRDGEPVGVAIVDLPPETEWLSGLVDASRVGYLQCLMVRDDVRRGTIGRHLVEAAHRRLGDAAVDAIVLHYAITNPLSVPFWHSQGYRPLWTHWVARPGATIFPTAR